MYLVYKAWSDSLENRPNDAFGYEVVGFVFLKRHFDKRLLDIKVGENFSWAAKADMNMYKIKKISLFKGYQHE